MKEVFKHLKLPIILLLVLLCPFLFGKNISYEVQALFFSFSLFLKQILTFILPFFIIGFVANTVINIGNRALIFFLALLLIIFLSNVTAIFVSYFVGGHILDFLSPSVAYFANGNTQGSFILEPLWNFNIKPIVTNNQALIVGATSGLLLILYPNGPATCIITKLNNHGIFFLKKIFVPIIPLFILGFIFKIYAEGKSNLIVQYLSIALVIISIQVIYLFLYYFIASKCSLRKTIMHIANMLPAVLTAFGTVSSIATMPVLLQCSEKNLPRSKVITSTIPFIVNIHTLGSAITITILTLALIKNFTSTELNFLTFAVFALSYGLAKFSVVAVPGGVIFVVVPLLQNILGFSDSMIGLITALYLLMDPIGTAVNVMGNGGFVLLLDSIFGNSLKNKLHTENSHTCAIRSRESI